MDKKLLQHIMEDQENSYIVHYSCQNLNDDNAGYSPRITSIAVLHLSSNQMSSFSLHTIAEELGISKNSIVEELNKIEKVILERFFAFAKSKGQNARWLHWNMRNIVYGFEHLEHRYRILTQKEPYHIDEKNRCNIAALMNAKYGSNYAPDPKMLSLMKMNGERHRDFLTGEEEVSAFKASEFVKMHKSTICKVYFFQLILNKMYKNTLRTKTNQFRYRINKLYQNAFVQLLGIIGVFGTIASLIVWIIQMVA